MGALQFWILVNSRYGQLDNQKQASQLGYLFLIETKDCRDERNSDTQSLKFVAEFLCYFYPYRSLAKDRECCYFVRSPFSNLQSLFITTNGT